MHSDTCMSEVWIILPLKINTQLHVFIFVWIRLPNTFHTTNVCFFFFQTVWTGLSKTFHFLYHKISSEWRSSGNKENIKEMKIADSVLLSLFMCSSVIVHHRPRPLAPAPADLYFQTVSEWAQRSQRTRQYIICTMMMYWETVYGRYTEQYQLQWR